MLCSAIDLFFSYQNCIHQISPLGLTDMALAFMVNTLPSCFGILNSLILNGMGYLFLCLLYATLFQIQLLYRWTVIFLFKKSYDHGLGLDWIDTGGQGGCIQHDCKIMQKLPFKASVQTWYYCLKYLGNDTSCCLFWGRNKTKEVPSKFVQSQGCGLKCRWDIVNIYEPVSQESL